MKGEVTGDIHVEITDASRQTLCNALKLQPDEDGIGATLSLRKNTGATREGCALSLLASCSLQNDG